MKKLITSLGMPISGAVLGFLGGLIIPWVVPMTYSFLRTGPGVILSIFSERILESAVTYLIVSVIYGLAVGLVLGLVLNAVSSSTAKNLFFIIVIAVVTAAPSSLIMWTLFSSFGTKIFISAPPFIQSTTHRADMGVTLGILLPSILTAGYWVYVACLFMTPENMRSRRR